MAGRFGGHVSFDNENNWSGLGIKMGRGINMGVTVELPLLGVAYQESNGWMFTGEMK
ncbi:hypothetical protein [Pseudoalteromonas sp.]|uniref:hypothetical protein n=1 Tax=Pseudoalteromonas sp. TaxID=53249 RepID=UPI00272CD8B1|nr:hypothetical protein [Pseudoalteromonas sp.]|tara:strand:- start:1961 stop:2131 length:171 start_codon:yes stop_codon:yes gene_type:complete